MSPLVVGQGRGFLRSQPVDAAIFLSPLFAVSIERLTNHTMAAMADGTAATLATRKAAAVRDRSRWAKGRTRTADAKGGKVFELSEP